MYCCQLSRRSASFASRHCRRSSARKAFDRRCLAVARRLRDGARRRRESGAFMRHILMQVAQSQRCSGVTAQLYRSLMRINLAHDFQHGAAMTHHSGAARGRKTRQLQRRQSVARARQAPEAKPFAGVRGRPRTGDPAARGGGMAQAQSCGARRLQRPRGKAWRLSEALRSS